MCRFVDELNITIAQRQCQSNYMNEVFTKTMNKHKRIVGMFSVWQKQQPQSQPCQVFRNYQTVSSERKATTKMTTKTVTTMIMVTAKRATTIVDENDWESNQIEQCMRIKIESNRPEKLYAEEKTNKQTSVYVNSYSFDTQDSIWQFTWQEIMCSHIRFVQWMWTIWP